MCGVHGQAREDRGDARDQRPDHRHDLDDAGQDAEQQPVRDADRPEGDREHRRDEGDHHELSADERAELRLDQVPGVAGDPFVLAFDEAEDDRLRLLLLEDPVGRDGEGEEDPDEDLEGLPPVRHRRVDQPRALREALEAVLQADEDLVLDPVRVLRRLRDVLRGRRNPPDGRPDLIQRAGHDQPEQEGDDEEEGDIVNGDPDGARDPVPLQPLHPRPHRRRNDQREQQQRDEHLQVPDCERARDHEHGDERGDERSASGVAHCWVVAGMRVPQTEGQPRSAQKPDLPCASRSPHRSRSSASRSWSPGGRCRWSASPFSARRVARRLGARRPGERLFDR